jgi:16S rRNA (guanine(966)-N(2))-methyltransferase RsmD
MRIIAGKHKGRVLNILKHAGTRPTSDRVREALFSKIQINIKNAAVLDLFSGTGALAFEALSRGANTAYLVDNNKNSYNLIVENNKLLKENANIINTHFSLALKKFADDKKSFDVIFLDPPYKTDLAESALDIISKNDLLNKQGIIVYEHDKQKLQISIPEEFAVYDQKIYGTVYLTFITQVK